MVIKLTLKSFESVASRTDR